MFSIQEQRQDLKKGTEDLIKDLENYFENNGYQLNNLDNERYVQFKDSILSDVF